MKILIPIGGFIPAKKYGGPVASILNLCDLFKNEDIEFYILTVDHDLGSSKRFENIDDGWNKLDSCNVMYLREREVKYSVLKKIHDEISPDIIYLNSLFLAKFTIPFLIISSKVSTPVLLAPRGDICKGFSGKYKKIPYILFLSYFFNRRTTYFQATSKEEASQIYKYLILGKKSEKIFELSNIPEASVLRYAHSIKEPGKLKCVFCARIQKKKNLLGAIYMLASCKKSIQFDIYGPIESNDYWIQCKLAISKLPQNIKVQYKGLLEHRDVKTTISKYDLFYFPTFSENYGHSIIEALQCGLPVLISDQTPWNDLEQYGAGFAFSLNAPNLFSLTIDNLSDIKEDEYNKYRIAAENYVRDKLKFEELKNCYRKAFEKMKNENV